MSGKASESTQERLDSVMRRGTFVGDAVLAPDFHDAGDELGFVVEIAPLNFAWLVGIVFEGEEGELVECVVGLQIVDEASRPGGLAGSVGPGFDVLVDAGEDGAAEFEFGIDAMDGGGELDVERGVILWDHEMAVGFFAHFDVGDGIAALFEVGESGWRRLRECCKSWRWESWREGRGCRRWAQKKRSKPTCSPACSSRSLGSCQGSTDEQ